MGGTRKLEKFGVDGTRRMESFDLNRALEDSRPSMPPPSLDVVAEEKPFDPSRIVVEDDEEPAPRSEPRLSFAQRALDREPDIERLRTRLARKFTTLADEVTAACAELQIGAGAWQPELTAPDGMSTASGKQGHIQHLRLRPKRQGHHVLVGGLVDLVEKRAELRTYASMVEAHEARFGSDEKIGFTEGEWEQFLRRAEVVLRAVGITCERVSPKPDPALRRKRKPVISRTTIAAAALGFIAPSAVVVLWHVFHRLAH